MSNLEKIEFFAHELTSGAKYYGVDDNESILDVIVRIFKPYSEITIRPTDSPDDVEVISTFKKEYELFSQLKSVGEREGIIQK